MVRTPAGWSDHECAGHFGDGGLDPAPSAGRQRRRKGRRRRGSAVENDEFAAFTLRVIRAHARRIGDGDIDSLLDLLAIYSPYRANSLMGRDLRLTVEDAHVSGAELYGGG
jgi:hypothetical protein